MTRRRTDSQQAKLKRQQRNQRYRANLAATERNREKNTLYQQKKRDQTRQYQIPLMQLTDIVIQQ